MIWHNGAKIGQNVGVACGLPHGHRWAVGVTGKSFLGYCYLENKFNKNQGETPPHNNVKIFYQSVLINIVILQK